MDTALPQVYMGKGVIILTYACNLKCSFCYAASEVFDRPGTMSLNEARRSVDFLDSIGIKTFTLLGGEPTVFKHLLEVVAYSRERGMGPWVVTNGTRICEPGFAQSLIDAGLKGGCVSLHGHSAEEHDRATLIAGSYYAAMKAIAMAVERDWPLFPMLTVMDSNISSVLKVVNNLIRAGCKTIYINYGIPNIVKSLDTGIDASPQALARVSEQLFLMQDDLGVRFIFNREKNKVPLCHFNHDLLKDMFEAGVIGTGCEAVQGNSVIVEPGGTILGCSHWVEHPLLNIYKNYEALELLEPEEFWEQWATGRPKEFRDELRYFPYEECEDCGWRKDRKCFGGCKVWQSAGALPKLRAFDDLNNSLPDNNPILGRLALPVLTELK
ncbi:MAG: hypothetical protein DMF61_09880 [Blastocatellia bacterium AA13]|nr:MAG: hypothetical protein DMF61_09880 [Blastocatellia bacterium AA13]